MMSPVVVFATELEKNAILEQELPWILSGVGLASTYRSLMLANPTGPLINLGICGAYPGTGVNIGDVVMVQDEVIADLGMENAHQGLFKPLRDYPFGTSHEVIECATFPFDGIPLVHACTVSTVTGTLATGVSRRDLYNATIETMEGYAVTDYANARGVQCVQLRAVSNIASTRDMQPQNIQLALNNLARWWTENGESLVRMIRG